MNYKLNENVMTMISSWIDRQGDGSKVHSYNGALGRIRSVSYVYCKLKKELDDDPSKLHDHGVFQEDNEQRLKRYTTTLTENLKYLGFEHCLDTIILKY